jgi:hypothetical protein
MCKIAIKTQNGNIAVTSPYNPEFVTKAKKLGGRWNSATKTWDFDERNIESVRTTLKDVYGQDDRPTKLVSVKVVLTKELSVWQGPVTLFGRVIASASGRDSGARIGEGVAFEKGSPDSGGSVKNWHTEVSSNSIILIHDLPEVAITEKLDWSDSYGTFEILNNNPVIDRTSLESEKVALLDRLAEIEKLLVQ